VVDALCADWRDVRLALDGPLLLGSDLRDLSQLQPRQLLSGVVRNVTPFGAFVDVGLKDDGLVHTSQLCAHPVDDPHDVVAVGQAVRVAVLSVDVPRRRLALSIKAAQQADAQQADTQRAAPQQAAMQQAGAQQAAPQRAASQQAAVQQAAAEEMAPTADAPSTSSRGGGSGGGGRGGSGGGRGRHGTAEAEKRPHGRHDEGAKRQKKARAGGSTSANTAALDLAVSSDDEDDMRPLAERLKARAQNHSPIVLE